METFLPSEIARLVLGYLKEENCQETSKTFMRECPHLREYLGMLNEGREFSTEVLGLSLKMILDEYGNMKLSRRTQATPALTNLWDKYELMGSQLRQSITTSINQTPQSTASRLVNNMHTFSRRQGSRNRYSSARTEGLLVVRSEVSVTTASAPANTPRRGTSTNARGSSFPMIFSLLPHTALVPGGVPVAEPDGRTRGWSLSSRRSQGSSQRGDDDLESVVSVGGTSSSTCDQIESNVVMDHTVMDDPGNEFYNQTLAVADSVRHQGSVTPTPAKIISPTSRSPLNSTQLTASTPGNFSKKSQQSAGSLVATDSTGAPQKNSRPSRRIQSKIINAGTDLSPIRALTSTSTTSCHATPVKSRCSSRVMSYGSTTLCNYGTVVTSSSVPVTTCYTATDDLSRKDGVTMRNAVALSKSAGDSIVLNPAMAVDNKTSPFHLFPLGSGDSAASSCNLPSFGSYPLVLSGSSRYVPSTSVPFNSCNSSPVTSNASTGFDFVPVTCVTVPVTSCNSVPSQQATVTSVPLSPCKLDKTHTRESVTPFVTDTLGTSSKRGSCSSFHDNGNGNNGNGNNGNGDNVDPLVPRTPVRSRRHVSKEFNSPRDRRRKAQPCKRRTSAELTSAPGCNTSATTSSISHSNGGASTIESNSAKGDLTDVDMNEMLERLISNPSIAEKIAENINNRRTTQNTSRSNPVVNTDDTGFSSNGPGTTHNTTSKSLSHRSDLAEDSASNLPPFESNQGQNHLERRDYHGEGNEAGDVTCESVLPSHSGDNNEIPGSGNNTAEAVDTGSVVQERSAVLQEFQQSGRPHDETVSDLSCTSLLSMSNLDQMTDDAIRFVFDQLCNDPNLDSICSMTSSSSSLYHHTERAEVDDGINCIDLSNQTSAIHFSSRIEQLVDCTPIDIHDTSTCEIPSSPVGLDLNPPDPFADDPPVPLASASVGFDTRRRYIQVCFPGDGGHPDRIDIVEVIGSGVEISNGQPSPDNRTSVADGSQTLTLVDSGQETASENPMLLSSQDMSSYLQSSTDVAGTDVASTLPDDDGSTSVWPSIQDPTTHEGHGGRGTFDSRAITSSLGYFSDCDVVASADLPPPDGSERGATHNIDSSLDAARLKILTIAEHDLGELKTSDAPRNAHEVVQRSNDLSVLEPSPDKVVSNTSASAVESGLCRRREKSVVDYPPNKRMQSGWKFDKSKRKKLHSGNSMKTPTFELKLEEKTGKYLTTSHSMEKKKLLGFGVPGKISENTNSQLVTTTVGADAILTCDVGQLHLTSSAEGPPSGSVPALKTPDSNADCIAISEVPSLLHNLEENFAVGRKETTARGRNLSKKKLRVLNHSRCPSTPSSMSTGSMTAGGISGPSTPSRGTVDPVTSIDVPSTTGTAVVGTLNGSTAVPTVSRVAVGSTGCSGDPVTSNVITSLPTASGSVVDLTTSSCSQSPRGPMESATVPSIPTDSASAPSNFTRCVIVPASDTSNMPVQKPCNVADESSRPNETNTSKRNSQKAMQTKSKSGVVYFEQDALSTLTENQKCFDRSSLSTAIPINSMPEFSSNNPPTNEKRHKSSHKSKKKRKHVRDSDKNTSSRTDKKGKSHRTHNSVDKRAKKSEKSEHSKPASHSSKKIDEVEKEFKNEHKELLSNVIQISDSSSDDDLPIAHFLKSGIHKDLHSGNSNSNTQLVTETLCPKSTLQETVSAIKILEKDKKSDGNIQANNKSSTQNSCQGLGQKVKATIEKQSKECSAILLDDNSLSAAPNCSLQPNASAILSQTVQLSSAEKVSSATNGPFSVPPDSNVGSEIVAGDCAEKNISTNSVSSTKTNWNKFKIPKHQHSSQGRISASNTDINSSASHHSSESNHSSESITAKGCKSMEHIIYDRWTSKTSVNSSVVTPAKSRNTSVEIPLESASKSRTESLSGGSKSIEQILSDLRKTAVGTPAFAPPDSRIKPAKTPIASTAKPRSTLPADSWKTFKPISKTVAETSRIAPPKSRSTSSQKTPITFTPKPRTVSPLTTSSIQRPKNSESISRKNKSPKKSASSTTQKHGSLGRSVLLCEADNERTRKHSRPKPPKTKKPDQAIVSNHPAPSLLSRANKVHEASTYTMSCNTILSMPSSFDGLIRLAEANRARVLYDDTRPIETGMETKPSEKNDLYSGSNPPVIASHPLESGDGRHDDVDIASALLSLSNPVHGDSNFAAIPRNALLTCGNSSTERTSLCIENSETGLEIHPNPMLVDDTSKTNLTNSDLEIVNQRHEKDSPRQPQAEPACVYNSDAIDLTVAARNFDLDDCCTKHLHTSSFSSPSIGLVLNIDEGTSSSSSPSTSTSACPSVPESHVDENPSSWPSEEVPKPSRKRSRSSSADSDSKAKKLKIRKQLKSLDITAFLKQLHQPKNTD